MASLLVFWQNGLHQMMILLRGSRVQAVWLSDPLQACSCLVNQSETLNWLPPARRSRRVIVIASRPDPEHVEGTTTRSFSKQRFTLDQGTYIPDINTYDPDHNQNPPSNLSSICEWRPFDTISRILNHFYVRSPCLPMSTLTTAGSPCMCPNTTQ